MAGDQQVNADDDDDDDDDDGDGVDNNDDASQVGLRVEFSIFPQVLMAHASG